MEAERRAVAVAAGIRILSAGARQDTLRRDFRAAAERIARVVELEQPDASADRGVARKATRMVRRGA